MIRNHYNHKYGFFNNHRVEGLKKNLHLRECE